METTTPELIHYKNFIIEREVDPWALDYGINFRFYREGSNGEKLRSAYSVEEARELIDEITAND